MPDICRDGCEGVQATVERGHADRVQVAGGVTAEDHPPGLPVLYRKAKMIKFHINRIITA
jgi:glycine/D-amino acid oxidase-like deaminating enzyme